MVTQETTGYIHTIHEIAEERGFFQVTKCVFMCFVFFCVFCCLPDRGEHVDVPNPVDVDGGAEVEVGLDGGRDLGKERHPVFLISEDLTITFNHLHFSN